MNEADIYATLQGIFRSVFEDDALTLQPALSARDVEGWDSVKQIEIIIAAEQFYKVRFKSRELDALQCVGDFVRLIAQSVN